MLSVPCSCSSRLLAMQPVPESMVSDHKADRWVERIRGGKQRPHGRELCLIVSSCLGSGIARMASGQVLGAPASGQSSTQRLLVRYWAQRLRAEIRCNGFGLGSLFSLLSHSWSTVSGQVLPKHGPPDPTGTRPLARHWWLVGAGRTASGKVLRARPLAWYSAQRPWARVRRNGFWSGTGRSGFGLGCDEYTP